MRPKAGCAAILKYLTTKLRVKKTANSAGNDSPQTPHKIATYSIAGASLGFSTLWIAPATLPLMSAVHRSAQRLLTTTLIFAAAVAMFLV